jgi:hypothetical protein
MYMDTNGNPKRIISTQTNGRYIFDTGNGNQYTMETLLSELKEHYDPSTTEVTITIPGEVVERIKVHARTAFLEELSRPSEVTHQSTGGSTRKNKGSKNDKVNKDGRRAPKAAPRWTSTGRKVTTKDGRSRVAFRNAAGELRVRKVTVGKDGKRTTRYITF